MDAFRVEAHFEILATCHAAWKGLRLPMATPAGSSRYPYVYPRDLASIARAYDRIGERHVDAGPALEAAGRFLIACQSLDGLWGQRYDLEAQDQSIYAQEDNTAHAVATLARHVRHARRLGEPSPIEGEALDAIERGLTAAKQRIYRKGINLYFSTTSIHESSIEQGYTLWTNGAYRDALRLSAEAADLAGRVEQAQVYWRRLHRHEENVRRHFVQDGQWIRRLTPQGRFDRRPDVTLLAPYYFNFEHLDPMASERSADRVERELWDPDLGLLQRYLPFREDQSVHQHAGNGPWLAYSAWLAQRHAAMGRTRRARELLDHIQRFASPEGFLPEHVSTRERFLDFMANEWETGLDFSKEFDREILLPNVGFSEILEEAVRMRDAYAAAYASSFGPAGPQASDSDAEKTGDGVIRFATPLAWCHAEFAVVLSMLEEREEKKE